MEFTAVGKDSSDRGSLSVEEIWIRRNALTAKRIIVLPKEPVQNPAPMLDDLKRPVTPTLRVMMPSSDLPRHLHVSDAYPHRPTHIPVDKNSSQTITFWVVRKRICSGLRSYESVAPH